MLEFFNFNKGGNTALLFIFLFAIFLSIPQVSALSINEAWQKIISMPKELFYKILNFFNPIIITEALHLDSNKNFISDISDQVKEKDDIWSEPINNNEYVRVTFEKNLTNKNDITIYARGIDGTSSIEVYTEDDNNKIAEITGISGENIYKTYLANLPKEEDTFDLKVIGNIEFDWIVDPSPSITSVNLTTTNPLTNDTDQNLTATISAIDADGDNITFAYNWYKNNILNATSLITNGLIAYYPLNNDSLDYWADYNGTEQNGVLLNTSGGIIGGAYKFDGVNDRININDSDVFSQQLFDGYTISLWIKAASTMSSEQYFISKGNTFEWGVRFETSLSTKPAFAMWKADGSAFHCLATSNESLSLNTWYNIVAIYNNNTNCSVYVNTVNKNTSNVNPANPLSNTNAPVNFGYRADNFGPFNGTIDEVMLFNRSLSQLELEQIYYGSKYGGNVMGAERTEIGDVWKLGVRGGDYIAFGDELNSSNVTILSGVNNPPSVTLNAPTNNTQFNNTQNINFNFTAADDISSTLNCSIYLDSNLNATNSSTQNNILTNFLINGINYGNHNWSVNCSDGSFTNISETRYFSINDTIAPQIQFVPPTTANGNYSQNWISANVTANDSGAGLNTITIYLYNSTSLVNSTSSSISPLFINFTNLVDGAYYLNATANDSTGNLNKTETRIIRLDTVKPTVILNAPANAYNTSSTSINFNWTAINGIDTSLDCNLTIDSIVNVSNIASLNNTPTNYSVSGFNDGTHLWNVTCWDDSGNTNTSSTRSFTVDTVKPSINITYPQNVTYNINVSQLNYTVSDSNLQACWYSLDNGINNVTITCGNNATGLASNEGSNTWRVYANDSAGNENSSSVTFFKDTIIPIITVTSPQNTTYINATILINFTADSYQALWFFNGTGNTTYVSPVYVTASQGSNTYIFYANDTLGNLNSTSITFFVDSIAPTLAIIVPQNITYNNATQLVNISSNGANVWFFNGTANETYVSPALREFSLGSNTIIAYANDTLGNLNSTSVTFSISIDTTPPVFTNLINHTTNVNQSFSYTLTATDASGISCFSLNDTSTFNVNCSGYLRNITALTTVNLYWLNASVNDTFNNIASRIFYINVTAVPSQCGGNFTTLKGLIESRPYGRLCHWTDFR